MKDLYIQNKWIFKEPVCMHWFFFCLLVHFRVPLSLFSIASYFLFPYPLRQKETKTIFKEVLLLHITIKQDKTIDAGTAELRCHQITTEITKIKSYAEQLSHSIPVKEKHEIHQIDTASIYYIESLEKQTFVYLETAVYETSLRLYQLEEELNPKYFLRISKGCIVNISYVTSIRLLLNRNLELTLFNGEKIIVSRRYVKTFQQLIEMR